MLETSLPPLENLAKNKVNMPENVAIFAPHAGFTLPADQLRALSVEFQEDMVALFDQTDWGTAIITHGVKNTVRSPGHRFGGDPNRDPQGPAESFIMKKSFGGKNIWDPYPEENTVSRQRRNREAYHAECCRLVCGLLADHHQVLVADIHDTSDWLNTKKGWIKRTEFQKYPEFGSDGYPAFVLSTLDGQTASSAVVNTLVQQLVKASQQYGIKYRGRPITIKDILINIENKGGYATRRMGLLLPESIAKGEVVIGGKHRNPMEFVNALHVVQIEVNRDDITGVEAKRQVVDIEIAHRFRLAVQEALASTGRYLESLPLEQWRTIS